MEVFPDGSTKTYQEYASVEYFQCDQIPDKPNNMDLKEFIASLLTEQSISPSISPPAEPTISTSEIADAKNQHKPISQNMSFKNKSRILHHRTAKTHH
ncbi:MAG: hypothetical protein WCJ61_11210 [Paludibacter sp.]